MWYGDVTDPFQPFQDYKQGNSEMCPSITIKLCLIKLGMPWGWCGCNIYFKNFEEYYLKYQM